MEGQKFCRTADTKPVSSSASILSAWLRLSAQGVLVLSPAPVVRPEAALEPTTPTAKFTIALASAGCSISRTSQDTDAGAMIAFSSSACSRAKLRREQRTGAPRRVQSASIKSTADRLKSVARGAGQRASSNVAGVFRFFVPPRCQSETAVDSSGANAATKECWIAQHRLSQPCKANNHPQRLPMSGRYLARSECASSPREDGHVAMKAVGT